MTDTPINENKAERLRRFIRLTTHVLTKCQKEGSLYQIVDRETLAQEGFDLAPYMVQAGENSKDLLRFYQHLASPFGDPASLWPDLWLQLVQAAIVLDLQASANASDAVPRAKLSGNAKKAADYIDKYPGKTEAVIVEDTGIKSFRALPQEIKAAGIPKRDRRLPPARMTLRNTLRNLRSGDDAATRCFHTPGSTNNREQ